MDADGALQEPGLRRHGAARAPDMAREEKESLHGIKDGGPRADAVGEGKRVKFRVVKADREENLGFDPADLSKGGNATCPFCGTVADSDYVKGEGKAGRIGRQAMAVVCTRRGESGKLYLSADDSHCPVPAER